MTVSRAFLHCVIHRFEDVMKCLILASTHAGVIIGFVQSEYDVLENQGILSIPVRIRGPNILRRSVTFNVTTQDGSAQGN